MSSPVAELEAGLQAMLGLKPPGVSGSRITGITTLCVNNIQVRLDLVNNCPLWLCAVTFADSGSSTYF
jgi:hypothetical protein